MNNRDNFFNLMSEGDRMLESIFSPFGFDVHVHGAHNRHGCKCLATFVEDNENDIVVTAEVPGLADEQVSVSMEDGVLTIKAEYGEDNSFRKGTWTKSYKAENIDVEGIVAKIEVGVLTITLPKSEAVKPKKIEIQRG